MRIHSPEYLVCFWKSSGHEDAQKSLEAWVGEARRATWATPAELKAQYCNASVLKSGRAVFNICGNKYRLIVKINYHAKVIEIRWVGTHADYDRLDSETI